jgi:hypothetical protein
MMGSQKIESNIITQMKKTIRDFFSSLEKKYEEIKANNTDFLLIWLDHSLL